MFNAIIKEINNIVIDKGKAIVAIDGRCAAGKTTLASLIEKAIKCNVIHMDEFFLRMEQRTEDRLRMPGGNVDYERFEKEVMLPLIKGERVCYRPFDCATMTLGKQKEIEPCSVTIIEGTYSCVDTLRDYYDIRIFLDIEPEEQLKRLEAREGKEKLAAFKEKWIPLEELYFEKLNIKEKCEICLDSKHR